MAGNAEQYYVVAGATFFCSKGTHFRRLDLPLSHGVYIRDISATNEDDCVVGRNIPTFGVCLSESNGSELVQTTHTDGLLPFENVTLPIIGKRCTPQVGKWIDAKEDKFVDGKPQLTVQCTLVCGRGGGVIGFVDNGQGVG